MSEQPQRPDEAAESKEASEVVLAVLNSLTYRQREILKLRYGIGGGYTYTLEELGKRFRVTRERVRQIEAKALRELRRPDRASILRNVFDTEAKKCIRPSVQRNRKSHDE